MAIIDHLIRDVASPVLRDLGYRRDGRNFRYTGSRGDVGIIHFASFTGRHDAEIIVDLAVAVVPRLDRSASAGFPVKPGKEDVAHGFWRDRLWGPPDEGDPDEDPSQTWGLDLGDVRAAERFSAALRSAATEIKDLAERENMIAAVRDPATRPERLHVRPRDRALAMLLVDEDGHDAELEQLLDEIQNQEHGGPDFVTWARSRRGEQTP